MEVSSLMTNAIDDIADVQQLNNFVNGIAKRLLLLLLAYFVNNIDINKIENKYSFVEYFGNVLNKIRKPMLLTLTHLANHKGTTRRLLEVEELIPSTTARWCLDWLLQWGIIRFQTSVKDYRGRNFKIYFLSDSQRNIVNLIEAKHIAMHHNLSSKWQGETTLEEEKGMLLFYCLKCKTQRFDTNYPVKCIHCGHTQMARIRGADNYEFNK